MTSDGVAKAGPRTAPPGAQGVPGVAASAPEYGSGGSVHGTLEAKAGAATIVAETPAAGPAAYLATLPEAIAEQLVEMVKVAADTSPSEKCFIVTWLESLATNIMANISCREDSTAIQLVAALGQMIAAVGEPQEGTHDVSTPGAEEVV